MLLTLLTPHCLECSVCLTLSTVAMQSTVERCTPPEGRASRGAVQPASPPPHLRCWQHPRRRQHGACLGVNPARHLPPLRSSTQTQQSDPPVTSSSQIHQSDLKPLTQNHTSLSCKRVDQCGADRAHTVGTAQVRRAVAAWVRSPHIPHRLWGRLRFAGLWPRGFGLHSSHRYRFPAGSLPIPY